MTGLLRFALALAVFTASSSKAQLDTTLLLDIERDRPYIHVFELDAGVTYEFEIEQHGVDVAIAIDTPSGATAGPFDSPLTDRGWEQLWYTPSRSGKHTVTVSVADDSNAAGQFRLGMASVVLGTSETPVVQALMESATADYFDPTERSEALAAFLTARQRLLEPRWNRSTAFFDHAIARLHEIAERPSEAIRAYRRAAETYERLGAAEPALWMQYRQASMETFRAKYRESRTLLTKMLPKVASLGEPSLLSATQNYIGVNHYYEGDFDSADDWIRRSLATIEATGHAHEQATTLYNLAWIRLQAGEAAAALDYFKRTLAIDELLGDIDAQVDTRVSIATTYRDMGDCGSAIHQLSDALSLAHRHAITRQFVRIHNQAATCLTILGDFRASTALLKQALEYSRQAESHREHADALYFLGNNAFALGELDQALRYYRTSLRQRRAIDDQEGIARSLIRRADVLIALGRLNEATEQLDVAQQVIDKVRTVSGEADYSLVSGKLRRSQGDDGGAEVALKEAMQYYRALHDTAGQFATYLALAAGQSTASAIDQRRYLDAAIELAEKPHGQIARPELRARYRAQRADVYFQRAKLDAQTFFESGDEQAASRSFITINRGVARTLAEQRLTGATVREASNQDMLLLQQRLSSKLIALKETLDNDASPESIASRLRADIELLQLKIDATAASQVAATTTKRLSLDAGVNTDAVDALQAKLGLGTAILQYSLSGSEGLIWVVDENRIAVQSIRNAEEIGSDARALHAAITKRRPYRKLAARLGKALLGPLSQRDYSRVLIVPDGALHYIPFSVLRHPSTGKALVDSLELQLSPSGLTLDVTPARSAIRSIAVLADAVYADNDVRIGGPRKHSTAKPLLEALGVTRSQPSFRLPFSAVEAEAIAELAGVTNVSVATGFAVTRKTLAAQLAEKPDALHIATHGVVDMEYAGLSGLVFSAFDAAGRPTNEFLSVPGIFHLGETPKVVVLSACETAIGEYIRSEGPLSIANAFLQQGSDHVVATLWRVADRSTADLIAAFYEELLKEGKAPAAALQSAQQQIKSSHRWRHPYYWAGFRTASVVIN